jgi:hypothetical protein
MLMKQYITMLLSLLCLATSCKDTKPVPVIVQDTTDSIWMLDFNKTGVNPIMTADSSYVFNDPVSNTAVI